MVQNLINPIPRTANNFWLIMPFSKYGSASVRIFSSHVMFHLCFAVMFFCLFFIIAFLIIFRVIVFVVVIIIFDIFIIIVIKYFVF